MDEVIDWPMFYNHRQLHSSTLAYISPCNSKNTGRRASQYKPRNWVAEVLVERGHGEA